MNNLEFFTDTTGTVYVQTLDGGCRIVTERDRDLISDVIKRISEIHPKTYEALMKQYAGSNRNKWFQEFLAFQRFARCNWATTTAARKMLVPPEYSTMNTLAARCGANARLRM